VRADAGNGMKFSLSPSAALSSSGRFLHRTLANENVAPATAATRSTRRAGADSARRAEGLGGVLVPALEGVRRGLVREPLALLQPPARWARLAPSIVRTQVSWHEAGIGKTSLACALARAVHGDGGLVLCARCDEGLAAPNQPFVEALRPVARAIGPDQLGAE